MKTFSLPFPPSTNKYYRNVGGVMKISAQGRAYADEVCIILRGTRPIKDGPIRLSVTLHMPDRRRRDIDNFAGKALLDALCKANVYADDSQIKELHVYIKEVRRGGEVVVTVEEMKEFQPLRPHLRQIEVDGAGV